MTTVHCFTVPIHNPEPALSELNAFMAANRVLALRREFVADGAQSCWAFCVDLTNGPGPLPAELRAAGARGVGGGGGGEAARGNKGGVDYKQLLGETDFANFSALRDLRKALALAEGVPVFAVFTNEQLAAIVTQRVGTVSALAAIEGVGPARLDKYGAQVLVLMRGWLPQVPTASQGAAADALANSLGSNLPPPAP
jgi:HRDC domain